MSLVGPRPCMEYETEQFLPHHFERFTVPAGITGLWQVTARAHATFREALELDVAYARSWSLALDAWLICRTPLHMFRRKGTAGEPRRRRTGGGGRSRLLGTEPRPQPPGARRRRARRRVRPEARRARADRPALPGGADAPSDFERVLARRRRSRPWRSQRPSSTHYALASAALGRASTCSSRSRWRRRSSEALELSQLADEPRAGADARPHVPVQPAGDTVRELIQSGELGDIYFISTSRVNLGLHQSDVSVVWDLGPHDFSILRYWLDETPTRYRRSAGAASCRRRPTSRSSTSSTRSGRSPTSSCRGSRRASCAARRSSAREKMVVYDDTSIEPVRVFDSGVVLPDPETFGEYRLTYRTGDIVSPHVTADEPLCSR